MSGRACRCRRPPGRARRIARVVGPTLLVAALATELSRPPGSRKGYGRVLGVVPYDFRVPTLRRVRERWCNPNDDRLLTEQVLGVGWSLNLARLFAARHF